MKTSGLVWEKVSTVVAKLLNIKKREGMCIGVYEKGKFEEVWM